MAELKSSYDVVVVGNDLPALIFGSLAAKSGYRVLLLGHGGRNNVYEEHGFHFVRRPNLMYGFTEAPSISEVFRELALLPEMRNRPRQFDPVCDVVLPRRRVEFSHVKDALHQELTREFPGQTKAFATLFNTVFDSESEIEPLIRSLPNIPPSGISEGFKWRAAKKLLSALAPGEDGLESIGTDPAARALLAAPTAILTGTTEPWRNPLTFNRAVIHLIRGLYNVEWGLDSLKALFLSRIEGNSGTVRAADSVDIIQVRRGRVTEIDIQGRNEAIGTSFLAAGSDFEELMDRMPDRTFGRRYRQKIAASRPTHYMVTMNIGIARKGLPTGMARNVFLVQEPGRPLENDNLLVVQVDPAMEPQETLDPERAVMSVSGRITAEQAGSGPAAVEDFCGTMLKRVNEFMPFTSRHLIVSSVPSIRVDERTGKDIVDMASLVPIYTTTMPGMMGLVSRPVRTPLKNLLNLGESACGSLGFEGAFTSAHMAFGILRKRLPKKDVIQHSR